jgi:hypothetical protein
LVDYVGALGTAPEPPFLVGDGTFTCQSCGDDTRVRIDGKCPACHEGIPSDRPLKAPLVEDVKTVNDRWQQLECQTYGCYGRDFKKRYRRTLDNDLKCLKCKCGWLVEDGQVKGPDPRSRTSSIMPPGFGWKWRWGELADAIDRDQLPEDECIEFIYKEVGGYRHKLWGGEPWIMYLTQVAHEFERYLDELEARKKRNNKGKEEQAWLDRNGLKSRDTLVLLRKLIEKSTQKRKK